MCHHIKAHLKDNYYFCDECNDKIDRDIYEAINHIPSTRLTKSEQEKIRSESHKIDIWENAPMVET